jgi:hypothetical protein
MWPLLLQTDRAPIQSYKPTGPLPSLYAGTGRGSSPVGLIPPCAWHGPVRNYGCHYYRKARSIHLPVYMIGEGQQQHVMTCSLLSLRCSICSSAQRPPSLTTDCYHGHAAPHKGRFPPTETQQARASTGPFPWTLPRAYSLSRTCTPLTPFLGRRDIPSSQILSG